MYKGLSPFTHYEHTFQSQKLQCRLKKSNPWFALCPSPLKGQCTVTKMASITPHNGSLWLPGESLVA